MIFDLSTSMMYDRLMKRVAVWLGKEIYQYAIVDDEDFEKISKLKWRLRRRYITYCNSKTTFSLHRLIMGAVPGQFIDHINGDIFDNRKANLRFCTPAQNSYNRKRISSNKSGYKGVMWRKNTTDKNWCASIWHQGKSYHLGYFKTKVEAARVYDQEAAKRFGEFARLNGV